MNKLAAFLDEHMRAIVIGAIAVVSVVFIIVIYSIICSGGGERTFTVDDISGNAFVLKGDGQINADRHTRLESGDVLITGENSTVILSADNTNKKIYVEPQTTLYIYYTDTVNKGSIVVNLTEGAAVCRLDEKLRSGAAFEVRTPNSVVSAKGTVFRTQFRYLESYLGSENVMVTDVQAVENDVTVQLYDSSGNAVDDLMLLAEKKSAQLMTGDNAAQYNYLNQDTETDVFSKSSLEALIRICAERPSSYSLTELNNAYQRKLNDKSETAPLIPDFYRTEEETTVTTTVTTVTTFPPEPLDTGDTAPATTTTTVTEATTTVPESVAPESISVTSPTTKVYTAQNTTAATTAPTAAPTYTTTTVAVPPIQRVTETTAATTVTQTETTPATAETTVTQSRQTTPWWEIINPSAAN